MQLEENGCPGPSHASAVPISGRGDAKPQFKARSGVASDEQMAQVTVERVPGPQSGHGAPPGSCEGVGQHGGFL